MTPAEAERYRRALEDSVPFKGLQPAALGQLMQHGLLLEAREGDLLLYENMRGGLGLYVVLHGDVEIFLGSAEADAAAPPVFLNRLGLGECFGEYSLIDGKSTSASARSATATKLFFLPGGEFRRLVDGDPAVASVVYGNLLRLMVARLREKNWRMAAD